MKEFNKFLLIGEVGVGPDGHATVECSETRPNRVYTEHLPIVLPPGMELKPGRHRIEGILSSVTTDDAWPSTIIVAEKVSKVKKSEEGMNVARVCGKMNMSFDLLDTNPDKRTMGWGQVIVGEHVPRFVAFSGLAHRLANGNTKEPAAKKGAEIQVQGRLRLREYAFNGKIRKQVEIVADADWTKVTKAAVMVDVFAEAMANTPDIEDKAAAGDAI